VTTSDRLNDVIRLHDLRARLSQQRLQRAIKTAQKRARLAEQGRVRHAEAQAVADAYVRDRFARANLSQDAGPFFVSLALGHQFARHDAVTLQTRAQRLSERQQDADRDRATIAQDHLKVEQRKQQFSNIAHDLVAGFQSDVDMQDEEEVQDLHAGRI
jgi:hypothetical protein